jgi:hypothetical protein
LPKAAHSIDNITSRAKKKEGTMGIQQRSRKRNFSICIILGLVLSLPLLSIIRLPASAATINFDIFPDGSPVASGTIITDQYLSLGASFDSVSGGPIAAVGLGEASSPPNFLAGNPDTFQPILVDFTNTVPRVGVTLISVGDATVTATAYDNSLVNVLDAVSVTNLGTGVGMNNKDPIELFGPGIARVQFEITQPFPGDGFGIDDLTIVPLPGAIVLLGSGIIGLIGYRRYRRRTA